MLPRDWQAAPNDPLGSDDVKIDEWQDCFPNHAIAFLRTNVS